MKTKLYLLLCLLPVFSYGQPIEATVLGHWSDESIVPAFFDNPYHDVWGAVIDGREIGIISSTLGFHFFDLNAQNGTFEPNAFAAATVQGEGIGHRDFKTYQHYLYAVADEGQSALQVFDMSGLPDAVTLVYESNEFVTTAHNIFIDEDNARLYIAGGNGFNLKILSLDNPEQPEMLASFPNADLDLPYIHDLYVRDNIAYLHAGWEGMGVVDFTDPSEPEMLGTLTSYIQQGYNHSGWLSEDGNYYYLCDETHGTDIKIVDVSDFSEMEVVATMNANSTPNQIAHNVIPQDDLLYASYYYDGLQVYDVSVPEFPRRVAYYDTSERPNFSFFAGAWGVFVLPSGRVLISDMNNGFYFFEKIEVPSNTSVTPNITNIELCQGNSASFSVRVGDDFTASEVTLSTENTSAGLDVSLGTTTAAPGEVVEVSVTALETGMAEIVITATDGTDEGQTTIQAFVTGIPAGANLFSPSDDKVDVDISPIFLWTGTTNASAVRFELSTDEASFDDNIFYSLAVTSNSLSLPIDLEEGTNYFWRIVATYPCGDSFSDIYSFTTEVTTSVREIDGNAFQLAPNPASDEVRLTFDRPLEQDLQIEWIALSGQRLKTDRVESSSQLLRLPVSDLPNGIYLLRLSTDISTATRKVMIQR